MFWFCCWSNGLQILFVLPDVLVPGLIIEGNRLDSMNFDLKTLFYSYLHFLDYAIFTRHFQKTGDNYSRLTGVF